jgi:hypothetical protein
MTASRCSNCTALVPDGALACSLCHAPTAAGRAATEDTRAVGPNGFLPSPPRAVLVEPDTKQYSRVRGGQLSFGLPGRLVLTAVALVPCWFVWYMSGGGVAGLVWSAPVFILPIWLLRETWKRYRVR